MMSCGVGGGVRKERQELQVRRETGGENARNEESFYTRKRRVDGEFLSPLDYEKLRRPCAVDLAGVQRA
jgi:hypothetical protein